MFETIIGKIGVPVLVDVLSGALAGSNNKAAKAASEALSTVSAEIKSGGLGADQLAELNRHAEEMARLRSAEVQTNLAETNASLRAEIASDDKFVRRMRPTFGYLMALTWAAQMLAIAYVIIFKTAQAGALITAMSSLSAIWGVGLSVLGIYVYKRSEDKKISGAGQEVIFWNDNRK